MINRLSIRYVTARLRLSDEHVLKTYSRSNLYPLSFIRELCNITECPWLLCEQCIPPLCTLTAQTRSM